MLEIGACIIPSVGFDFDWIIQFCLVEMIKHAQGELDRFEGLKGKLTERC